MGGVDDLLAALDDEERAALTSGLDMWHSQGVERLGIRGLVVTDGPNGARGSRFVGTTSACLPCGTALGATWDVALVGELGALLGDEARTKGADLLLAPTVNLHRTPLAGRNFECFSEDPFLTARLAVAYVEGVQSRGVGTAVKHLVGNDSEFERHTISSEIDERTLRELYLVPFEAAIGEARSWSVMAAYNRLGGVYCSEHEVLMRLVHDEWRLPGFVISDWWSIQSTDGTGRHGCDLEMPGPPKYLGPALADAVAAGRVPATALEDKARRILTTMHALGALERDELRPERSVDRPEHRALIRRAARDAIVLLQNRDGALPLVPGTVRRVAVIGPNADVAVVQGGGSAAVNPHHAVTVHDGIAERLGDTAEVLLERGVDGFRNAPPLDPRWIDSDGESGAFRLEYFANRALDGAPVRVEHTDHARLVWMNEAVPEVEMGDFSVRLSGTFVAPEDGDFTISLVVGGHGRLYVDDELVVDMWDRYEPGTAFFGLGSAEVRVVVAARAGERRALRAELACFEGMFATAMLLGGLAPTPPDGIERAAAAAAAADAAVVVVGLNQDWETEGEDRASTALPGRQDDLVRAVAAANPRTIVLVNAGSVVDMDWADDVAAIAQIWYLGQESGNAVADVLVGDHSPGGRLPTTFAFHAGDHPAMADYPGSDGAVHYREGLHVGYRGFDVRRIDPRFCFGHGLTYTTFAHDGLRVQPDHFGPGDTVTVEVSVTNTGDRRAAEVVQCYVRDVESSLPRPVRELKGFAKVELDPGESQVVRVELDERAFSFWDPDARAWVCEPGDFVVQVGASSRDLRAEATVTRRG